jgi:hypothetical protein
LYDGRPHQGYLLCRAIHREDPLVREKTTADKEEPSWNMMGDKFQLGPFTDVIDAVLQRVTPVTKFF